MGVAWYDSGNIISKWAQKREFSISMVDWLIILWCLNDVQLYSHLMQFIRISIWSIPHFDSVSSSIISSFQLGEARRIAQAHNVGDGADAWLPLRFAVSPGVAGYEATQN